jgi:Bacterial regulatory helix-turn-helix protein, lysR family
MQIRQIRYFLAICAEGNFTRAARSCGVSQPSLTQALLRLEAELGGALFERGWKESRLTELGTLVRRHLVDIARSERLAKRKAADFAACRRQAFQLNSQRNGNYHEAHLGDAGNGSTDRGSDIPRHRRAGNRVASSDRQKGSNGHQSIAFEP